jgi:adenine specific DNA methylase Mod
MNHLYYGDNLHVLRKHLASESVDLIYLAPPFNSKRDYNVSWGETKKERVFFSRSSQNGTSLPLN